MPAREDVCQQCRYEAIFIGRRNPSARVALVRRADAGEPLFDDSHLLEANEAVSTEESLNDSQR
jgi:hypothetical protein